MKSITMLKKIIISLCFILPVLFIACENPEPENPGPENPGETTPEDRFIAVGANGTIMYSDDYGQSFTTVDSGTTEILRDVAADDAGHVAAVGYNGTVLYSSDYGLTWNAGTVSTIRKPNSPAIKNIVFSQLHSCGPMNPAPIRIRNNNPPAIIDKRRRLNENN